MVKTLEYSGTVRTLPVCCFRAHFYHPSLPQCVSLPKITNSINMYHNVSCSAQHYLPTVDCNITTASSKAREQLFYFHTAPSHQVPRQVLGSTAVILNITEIMSHKEHLAESKWMRHTENKVQVDITVYSESIKCPLEFPQEEEVKVFTAGRGNCVCVREWCVCVCHLLEGTSTNADYMTDGTAVRDVMNAIVK